MTDIAVDLAVASALVGRSPRWLARRGLDPRAVLMGSKGSSTARNPRAQRWTEAELEHLRAQLPYKSDEALAAEGVIAPAGSFYALEASRHAGLGDAGGVRVGLSPYTTTDDLDRLVVALGRLGGTR